MGLIQRPTGLGLEDSKEVARLAECEKLFSPTQRPTMFRTTRAGVNTSSSIGRRFAIAGCLQSRTTIISHLRQYPI
jgi:hypothetical protein